MVRRRLAVICGVLQVVLSADYLQAAEDKLGAIRASCLAALCHLCASDSFQAAVTALYAKLLVIMGRI